MSLGIISLGACAFTDPQSGMPAGGSELQLHLLARMLARRGGFLVTLYVADCGQDPREENGLRIAPLVRLNPSLGINRWAVPGIISRLARGRHDLYITRSASAINGLAWIASRCVRARTLHMCAHDDECDGKADATLSRPARWLHHLGLRRADLLTCQNEFQRQLIQNRFKRSAVLAPSIPPEMPRPAAGTPRAGFLWVGRDVDWKRPEVFLELARRLPDQNFTMVCQPQPGRDLSRLSALLPENVKLLPGLPPEKTAELFLRHRAFVMTSSKEGFPNVILQAAGAGTPVLSMAVDPDNMITTFRAGVLCGDEIDQLAWESRRLVDSEELWQAHHAGALRLAGQRAGDGDKLIKLVRAAAAGMCAPRDV